MYEGIDENYEKFFRVSQVTLIMLFNKKSKKIVKNIWIALGILVIVSMLFLYTPIFF